MPHGKSIKLTQALLVALLGTANAAADLNDCKVSHSTGFSREDSGRELLEHSDDLLNSLKKADNDESFRFSLKEWCHGRELTPVWMGGFKIGKKGGSFKKAVLIPLNVPYYACAIGNPQEKEKEAFLRSFKKIHIHPRKKTGTAMNLNK